MNYEYEKCDVENDLIDLEFQPNSHAHFTQVFGQCNGNIEGDYLVYDPVDHEVCAAKSNDKDTFLNTHGSNLIPESWNSKDKKEVKLKIEGLFRLPRPPLPKNVNMKSTTAPFIYDGWLFAWKFFPEMTRWELSPLGRQ